MDKHEHIKRHKELHGWLDELVADYIRHGERLLHETSVMDFMDWSYEQTKNPTKDE